LAAPPVDCAALDVSTFTPFESSRDPTYGSPLPRRGRHEPRLPSGRSPRKEASPDHLEVDDMSIAEGLLCPGHPENISIAGG
jgi:hypothetical protein